MAITHTFTISWTNGTSVPSRTLAYNVDTEWNFDAGFIASGQTYASVNDPLPPVANWATFHATFPGDVRLRTHLSGSYLSGGVGTTLFINSGKPISWYNQTSGMPNPFLPVNQATPAAASGTITSISLFAMGAPAAFSGSVRIGFSGTLVSG